MSRMDAKGVFTLITLTLVAVNGSIIIPDDYLKQLKKRSATTLGNNFFVTNFTFPCSSGDRLFHTEQWNISGINTSSVSSEQSIRRITNLDPRLMELLFLWKRSFNDQRIKDYIAFYIGDLRSLPNSTVSRSKRSSPHTGLKSSSNSNELHTESKVQKKQKNRKRRDATENLIEDEICTPAGHPSEDDPNYVHLCKICRGTRRLPPNKYPQTISETYCHENETSCLGPNNNGKCKTTVRRIHILTKQTGVCTLCGINNDIVIVDEWKLEEEDIGVGCECQLDKNSRYNSLFFTRGHMQPVG